MPSGVYKHKPLSEEAKKNLSEKNKGKFLSEEHKKKIGKANSIANKTTVATLVTAAT